MHQLGPSEILQPKTYEVVFSVGHVILRWNVLLCSGLHWM